MLLCYLLSKEYVIIKISQSEQFVLFSWSEAAVCALLSETRNNYNDNMIKFWFKLCVTLLVCATAIAQDKSNNEDYDDPWYNDYDQWYQDELDKIADEDDDDGSIQDNDVLHLNADGDSGSSSSFDDYQIEDNRSVVDDDLEDIPSVDVKQPENIDDIVKEAKELMNKADSKMEMSLEKVDAGSLDNLLNTILDDSKEELFETGTNSITSMLDAIKKIDEDIEDKPDTNEVLDYEDKNDRPFHEKVALEARDDLPDDVDEDAEDTDETEDLTVNESKNEKIIPYGEDGLKDKSSQEVKNDVPKENNNNPGVLKPAPLKNYDDDELKQLIPEFIAKNKKEIDTLKANANPNYISINYNENIVVVSPRYPDNYLPEDNVFDYVLQGDGMGIELNVTEVNINGAANDFLLIKPGGVEAPGKDGLVFSYNLNSERRFRFMEVDRLFVRFQTHATAQPVTGFLGWSFSIRLLGPRPSPPEPAPEPELTIPVARYTYTRYFGGVTPQDFEDIRGDFLSIIIDMATMYVEDHEISAGKIDIAEVANVTSVSVCNLNWPDYDNCAVITFAIPLKYDEEDLTRHGHRLHSADLKDMWENYSVYHIFATRLQNLGLTDFNKPNDGKALVLWLVIGTACLFIAISLAFALWRWNCFQNYTRMSNYSDTDSVLSHKKEAGLYPTPYQDLTALYAQPYNQLTTADDPGAVDMGFNNKSFVRYSLFDNDFHELPPKMSARSDK